MWWVLYATWGMQIITMILIAKIAALEAGDGVG
jgi:hypothetical protein